MVEIQSKQLLEAAIRNTEKPISFLVGAPLSWDGHSGVLPVSGMIELIREEIQHRDVRSLPGFDDEVGDGNGPDVYQKAMSFLQGCFDPEVVGSVIQQAVLRARRAGAPDFDFPDVGEGRFEDWHVPAGIQAMARLIRSLPEKFTGPILTTNFDPLIHLALGDVGLRPRRVVVPTDGSMNILPRNHSDEIDVFHLHGYWRDSPTLHTPAQLNSQRPQLQQSLQRLLRQRTLVVIAYGGWDDIITTALENCLNDDQFEGSIRWCFYGQSEAELREQHEALFQKFSQGINMGLIQFYREINCHTIFDDVLRASGAAPNAIAVTQASPLAGWDLVDNAYLDALEPLRGDETVGYFDGAIPTWRHAVSDLIPRLSHVDKLTERLQQGRADTAASSLQIIRAAGGEGKSTLLMQVAADAARSGDWSVLWRPSPELGLNPVSIAGLAQDRSWLIVADDAETLVDDLWLGVQRLHEAGRSNVFFLLASRDTDWRGAHGDRKRWDNRLHRYDDWSLGDVILEDARLVVDAWGAQGAEGLRALAHEPDREARASALRNAAHDQDRRSGDGSFFGGLLATRFDEAGLRAHVRGLMDRLRGMPVEHGTGTLFDALLYIAACHAVRIPGVDKNVLADLVGVPRDWVMSRIVRPLGAECGTVHSAGHIMTRHSRVASAIIVEAEDAFDIDLEEVWTSLIRVTAECGREGIVGHQSHGQILHAGPRLERALPDAMSEDRRRAIAIAAAVASRNYQSNWLGCIVDLGKTYRFAKETALAIEVFCEEYRNRREAQATKVDWDRMIRGFFYEWGTCEGNVGERHGHLADVWLGGMSLSDQLRVAIDIRQVMLPCAGLGVAFGKVTTGEPHCVFAKARRAVTDIGWRTNPDNRAMGYFRRYERELDAAGVPHTADIDEAINWLSAGILAAYEELTDRFLRELNHGGRLTFGKLHELLA